MRVVRAARYSVAYCWRKCEQALIELTAFLPTFCRETRGNVTTIFTISLIPIMASVGAAVDFSHANSVKSAMQASLDATGLFLSTNAAMQSQAQMEQSATNYFAALLNRPEAKNSRVSVSYGADVGSKVTLTATSQLDTDFMGIMGFKQLTITATSQIVWGNTKLRVALALDNTGSMAQNNKMSALKTATKQLLQTLQYASSKPGDVLVSIVPFAKDVNIGSTNVNATWLKWDDWDKANGTWVASGPRDNRTYTWVPKDHNTWNGCVTDRDQDYDALNTTPDLNKATQFPAEQATACPAALLALGSDWLAMNRLVDDMQPNGNTNQTIGLAWAWQTLTQGVPLNGPAPPDKDTQQVIVLVTDGNNTQNRFSSSEDKIDLRTEKICTNIKNAGILIYTVRVFEGNATLLQNCATRPDMYFSLSTSGELVTTFNNIAINLTKLRVAH
jgi:Flp pilus assembly protein TadG